MTAILRDLDTEFVQFEFETADDRRQIVFRRVDAEEATAEIMDEYSIPRQGSRSLLNSGIRTPPMPIRIATTIRINNSANHATAPPSRTPCGAADAASISLSH